MSIRLEEIDALISKMTLKEKVGQLNQQLYGWQCYTQTKDGNYELTGLFKKHVQDYGGIGALYGVFRADAWSGRNEFNGIKKEDSLKVTQMIQNYINDNTRLKIPVLISEECVHGHQGLHSTMYPTNLAMGMTWNPDLLQEVTTQVSNELASKGGNLALYAALDIVRDPRWGRSEECLSEDPYLSSIMTKAAVKGFQHTNNGVAVVLKHLCAQGACVGGHNSAAAVIGERELREIYLPPVKAGVEAGALGAMAAYNEIDGIPCHVNKHLLTDILREEYGYQGVVMSDGCALDRLLMMEPNPAKAAAMALKAGIDLSLWDNVFPYLEEAVLKGYLSENELNQQVKRVLTLKQRLGLFDDIHFEYDSSKEKDLALKSAKECQVLLKNDGLLPLDKQTKRVAVIGPNAHNRLNMLGDYTSFQKDDDIVTLYEGIQKVVNHDVEVNYALGCQIRSNDDQYIEEAVNLAKESDIVILALGGSSARSFKMEFESNGAVKTSYDKDEMNCGENVDMASLELEGLQMDLFRKIKEVNPHIVTVLIQGRPHSIAELSKECPAILASWYPGCQGGLAIAQTLFGDYNPTGRLSVSIPRSSMQLPCYYNGKTSGAKIDYIDMLGTALYPFGYGLSYCECEYKNIKLSTNEITLRQLEQEGLDITLDIHNESDQDTYETVQIYTVDNEATITRRTKELKAFDKVFVKAHSSSSVSIHLDIESFKIWNNQMKHVVEEGTVDILVAKHSENYESKILKITHN